MHSVVVCSARGVRCHKAFLLLSELWLRALGTCCVAMLGSAHSLDTASGQLRHKAILLQSSQTSDSVVLGRWASVVYVQQVEKTFEGALRP